MAVNDVAGLTAIVTSGLGIIPDGFVFSLGSGSSGTLTVTAGQITFASAYFQKDSNYQFLGTEPFRSTYYPQLFIAVTDAEAVSMTAPVFSPLAAATVTKSLTRAMIVRFGMIGNVSRQRAIVHFS